MSKKLWLPVILALFCGQGALAQHMSWAAASWAYSNASSGGGATLPADAAGLLANDGAGTLSWSPCLGYAATVWTLTDCTMVVTGTGPMAGRTATIYPYGIYLESAGGQITQDWDNDTGGTFGTTVYDPVTQASTRVEHTTAGIAITATDASSNPSIPTLVGVGPIILVKTQADSPVTLTLAQSGARLANTGTTAQVEWLLPPAASGAHFVACSIDSDGMKLTADAGDTITLGADTSGAAGNITATSGCATFTAFDTTRWLVESATSTWTVSAP